MEKRISVKLHLKRYIDVRVEDKRALVAGLNDLIENDRKALIERMRQDIALLESGKFPEAPVKNESVDVTDAEFEADETNQVPDSADL